MTPDPLDDVKDEVMKAKIKAFRRRSAMFLYCRRNCGVVGNPLWRVKTRYDCKIRCCRCRLIRRTKTSTFRNDPIYEVRDWVGNAIAQLHEIEIRQALFH